MIHKQIYNSSFFSTTGRISRGIFIERILLITVLFLLTYSILLHYAGENKSSFLVYDEHLIRYFLISLWMLFSLIQYIKRIHDCSRSFIQSLKNPFIIFTKGTYGSNKYGLLSDDIYYIKGVKDFNKDEFLAYQKKGNQRAIRSLLLIIFAIIMILVFRMYNPSITSPPEVTYIKDSTKAIKVIIQTVTSPPEATYIKDSTINQPSEPDGGTPNTYSGPTHGKNPRSQYQLNKSLKEQIEKINKATEEIYNKNNYEDEGYDDIDIDEEYDDDDI